MWSHLISNLIHFSFSLSWLFQPDTMCSKLGFGVNWWSDGDFGGGIVYWSLKTWWRIGATCGIRCGTSEIALMRKSDVTRCWFWDSELHQDYGLSTMYLKSGGIESLQWHYQEEMGSVKGRSWAYYLDWSSSSVVLYHSHTTSVLHHYTCRAICLQSRASHLTIKLAHERKLYFLWFLFTTRVDLTKGGVDPCAPAGIIS